MTSDEQMYCTGGYQLSKGLMIYRDFPYVTQLPYHPLLCAALYKITGTTHYLLTARLISVVFDVIIIICIFSIIRKIFAEYFYSGITAGLTGAALFVFNPFSSYLCGLAWNHDMVLLCIVLAFRIFLGISTSSFRVESCGSKTESRNRKIRNSCLKDFSTAPQRGFGRNDRNSLASVEMTANNKICMFAIASLLTIAAWTRATSVFVMPVFFAIIIYSAWAKAHPTFTSLFAMASGVIVFSIIPIWIIVESGRAFFINIFTMSMLHGQLLHQLHLAYDKGYLTITALRNREFLFLILTAVFSWFAVFGLRKRIQFTQKTNTLLALLVLAAMIGIAYFPPTMWKQYFGIPVAFLIIIEAYAIFYLRKMENKIPFKTAICIFTVLAMATAAGQKPITKISKILEVKNYTPIKVHNISKSIVAKTDSQLILTLSPLYAIEGGGEIYTELSAGVSAFRVADKLSQTDREICHVIGLREIPQITADRPAGAIVIGPELTRFDKIDLKSIVPSDWQRVNCKDASVHAFFPRKQP